MKLYIQLLNYKLINLINVVQNIPNSTEIIANVKEAYKESKWVDVSWHWNDVEHFDGNSSILMSAFHWDSTKQGGTYWEVIDRKLPAIQSTTFIKAKQL